MLRKLSPVFSLLLLALVSLPANASAPIYEAINYLVQQFQKDIPELAQATNRSTIISVKLSGNLEQSIEPYLLKRLEGSGGGNGEFRFVECLDCQLMRDEVAPGQASGVVTRQPTDPRQLVQIASRLGVNTYTEVRLDYTGSKLILQMNFYNVGNGSVVWARNYETRLLNIARANLSFSGSLLQMFALQTKGNPFGVSIFGAERIFGLGEVGLFTQFSFPHEQIQGNFIVGPRFSLALNDFMLPPWTWGALNLEFQAGYGWYNKNREINLGTALKLESGRIFHIKSGYMKGLPLSESNKGTGRTRALPGMFFVGVGADLG